MRGIRQAKQGHTGSRRGARVGLCLAAVAAVAFLGAPPAEAAFGIASLSTAATNADGTPDLLAGSHPFAYGFDFRMNTDSEGRPEGGLRTIEVDLPPGLVGDPGAVPSCSRQEFDGAPHCQPGSQVGVVEAAVIGIGEVKLPLYNLTPPPGYVASFGGGEGNSFIELVSATGSGAESHLTVTVPMLPLGEKIVYVAQTLWGVPADTGHDGERGACLAQGGSCRAGTPPAALLTLPVHCGAPPTTTVALSSSEAPGRTLTATAELLDSGGEPRGLVGCDALPFAPRVTLRAEGAALSPTGLGLEIGLGPSEQPEGRAAAPPREATLELPPGLALNPAAGSGLAACAPGQIGLRSGPGAPASFGAAAPACPDASRIGTVSADLPPLGEPLSGTVYLAAPGQNPYGTRFAMYMVLEDPARGVTIKVPARLDADPLTGRLSVAITDLPEFPFTAIAIRFLPGPRALFAAPPLCGTYAVAAALVPSTAPEESSAHLESRLSFDSGPGGACPAAEAARRAPSSFEAGSVLASAGRSSELVLKLTRTDLDQHFGTFHLTLPPGLGADLGSVPVGAAIGSVRAEAGLGPRPLGLTGTVYLGGPYQGAPYSLEAVVPAAVGPFDLGTTVVRATVTVDPRTAQIGIRTDPLPRILGGVPLELRALAIDLDRPGFVRNPTSCEPLAFGGSATSALGQGAPLSARFQVGGCRGLAFAPKVRVRLKGAAGRNGTPALVATLTQAAGQANVARASVALPHSEFLEQEHIKAICSRVQFAARQCPKASIYGSAEAVTPLLDQPLRGPVYLRASNHRLPDMVVALRGPATQPVEIDLDGRIDSIHGGIRTTFEAVPDAPVSRFVLRMRGGKRGLIVNSTNLCRGKHRATVRTIGHNGARHDFRAPLRAGCGKQAKEREQKKHHRRHAHRGQTG